MKIVQVIHSFLPYHKAGSEMYTYALSKELSNTNEIIVFHRISDSSQLEYATNFSSYDGLNVFTINNTFKNSKSFEDTYINDSIAAIFGEFLDLVKPDLVHFEHITCLSTTCIKEAKSRNIPIVYTIHDYWLLCQRGQLLNTNLHVCTHYNELECARCMSGMLLTAKFSDHCTKNTINYLRKYLDFRQTKFKNEINNRSTHILEMLALVDAFIAPSKYLISRYVEFGIDANKVHYIDHGFDHSQFENVITKKTSGLTFAYIGTLLPSKGIHVLIEAFNKLQNDFVKLEIYGKYIHDGGKAHYLHNLKGLVKNKNIEFMGEYDNKDLSSILSTVDVVVVPSIWPEIGPLTINEAFLSGVPVIASNFGGMAERVQHMENGLLFEMGNSADLYDSINLIIQHPEILDKFKINIPHIRSISEMATEIENLYISLKK